MQTNDVEVELPSPCLSSLDSALNRLGMLATTTESRRDYLSEIKRKPYVNMVRINTRYVSNVSIGFRVRPLTPHVRYKPYTIKERHRTRSENNDGDKDANVGRAIVDNIVRATDDLTLLKKAKSLESVVAESDQQSDVNLKNIAIGNCPELDVVSSCIQNLKVDE